MMNLSFLTRRTGRTTRQLQRMNKRIIYLSFLTRRRKRMTRQLSNRDMIIIYLKFLKVPSSQIGSA